MCLADHAIFVDFMYAVSVGTAMPRVNSANLSLSNSEFWGVWFFIAVFLEDFYLYHTRVAPVTEGHLPSPVEFIVEILIIAVWYVAQISFPTHPKWYTSGFGLFFGTKLVASMVLAHSVCHIGANWAFLIPVIVGFGLAKHPKSRWKSLAFMCSAWLVTITLWWAIDPYSRPAAPPQTMGQFLLE
jgi:hypothetical protein